MKSILLTFTLAFTTLVGWSQSADNAYGPVETKELKETIGQTYVVIALSKQETNRGYTTINNVKDGQSLPATAMGTHLILKSIDDNHHAFFADSLGNQYRVRVYEDSGNQMLDIMLLSDLLEAKKMYLNKTLWLNDNELWLSDHLDESVRTKDTAQVRFDPIIVQDIYFSSFVDEPLIFKVKTSDGKTGYVATSVSGTNTNRLPENLFSTHFFEKDPKTRYHFTPAVWKMVKAGYTAKGMPMEAFILVTGNPAHINHMGNRTQLVYGSTSPTYYYFENGKLVSGN